MFAMIGKSKVAGDLGYGVYRRLFHTCVCMVTDYSAEVWGSRDFKGLDDVEYQVARYFLGLGAKQHLRPSGGR